MWRGVAAIYQPFLVYENGDIVWKKTEELKEGDYVARLNKIDTEEKSQITDFKKITIPNPSEYIFPPQIKLLLEGVKQDGRKRIFNCR